MAWDCLRFRKLEILWESAYFLGKSIFVKSNVYHRNLLVLRSFWQNTRRDCWKWTWFAAIKTGARLWSREFWSPWNSAVSSLSTSWSAGGSCYNLVSRLFVTGLFYFILLRWFGIQGLRGDIRVQFLLTGVLEAECKPERSCDTKLQEGWWKAAMGQQIPAQKPDGCDPPRSHQGWMVT